MATVEARLASQKGLLELALQRERLGFWMHFSAFALVNLLVFSLNIFYSPSVLWFIFVLFPWSVGVVAHYIGAFYLAPIRAREKELRLSA